MTNGRRIYAVLVAAAVAATAMAAWQPQWGGGVTQTADLPYLAVGLATTVAVAVGAHGARGRARLVWGALAIGMGLTSGADIAYVVVTAHDPTLVVSPLDVVYLSSYVFFGAGLWILARARSASIAARASLDGLALAAGLGLLVWEAVIVAPGGFDETTGWLQAFVLGAYPLLDLLLFAGMVTVLLSSRRREPALWGLVVFVGLFLVSDLAFAVVSVSHEAMARWADVGFALSFVALGLAALDRSATTIADPVPAEAPGLGRFLILGLSMAAPGITAAVAVTVTGGVTTLVLVATTTGIAAVLTVRVAWTMRAEAEARHDAETSEARLTVQMMVDGLTCLPNRTALLDRLAELFEHHPPALLFVDLDHFKVVNDSAGHTVGDEVLVQAAQRIVDNVGPHDEVFRLAGDEFIVLCPDGAAAAAGRTATTIVDAFGAPFVTGALEWFVGASVGIAVGTEADAPDPERLLRDADLAMYEAKRAGRRSVRHFDAAVRARFEHRQELETSIRHAVRHGEIEPAFQPVVNLVDGEIAGFEALARWNRAPTCSVTAEEFIDVAEDSGVIAEIDGFVLLRACHFIREWNARRPDRAPAWLSVNLSAEDLAAGDLVTRIRDAVASTGVDPGWLILELTESALAVDPELVTRRMAAVRELGVGLAIDDFGTGSASLAQLLRFPVDLLKIDRVFVDTLGQEGFDRSVAAAALRVATTIGIPAVAQGIETAEQARLLTRLGFVLGQGFHLGRPVSAVEALRLQVPLAEQPVATTPTTVG